MKTHLKQSSKLDEFCNLAIFQGTCHTYFGSNLETFKVYNRDRLPLIPDEATISEQEFNIVFWVNISHTQENVWKCGDEEERLLHNYYSMWIGRREGTTLEKERKKRYLCLTLRRPKARFCKRTKNLLLSWIIFLCNITLCRFLCGLCLHAYFMASIV